MEDNAIWKIILVYTVFYAVTANPGMCAALLIHQFIFFAFLRGNPQKENLTCQ